jgi:thiamine kinase-like enzyme
LWESYFDLAVCLSNCHWDHDVLSIKKSWFRKHAVGQPAQKYRLTSGMMDVNNCLPTVSVLHHHVLLL